MTFLRKAWFLHPALFALTPILFLYAHNMEQVLFSDALLPLGVSIVALVVMLFVLWLLLRDKWKAGVLCSTAFILFFCYGHVYELLKGLRIGSLRPGRTLVVLPLFLLAMAAIAVKVIRSRKDQHTSTRLLNLVGLFFLLSIILNIGWNVLKAGQAKQQISPISISEAAKISQTERPDIFYIIHDGYAREDVLRDLYSFDNSDFLSFLRSKGFFVADSSNSNYAITFLSLASSLNMTYLDDLYSEKADAQKKRSTPYRMIDDSALLAFLKAGGYQVIHFSSGWGATDYNPKADINLSNGAWNEFLMIVFRTSMLSLLQRFFKISARAKITNTFRELASLPASQKPRFVFAHIICPHPPYLFDKNGGPVKATELSMYGRVWENKDAYLNQLVYVNKRIKQVIDSLLTAEHEPVIIIQADHGTAFSFRKGREAWKNPGREALRERHAILNAFYLPRSNREIIRIPQTITPVNTFRLVLASVFQVRIDLLEDRSFFSSYETPYLFSDVTSALRQ